MSFLRFVVTVSVASPLFLMVGWPHPMYITMLVACVSLGAGHLVELLVKGPAHTQRDDADTP